MTQGHSWVLTDLQSGPCSGIAGSPGVGHVAGEWLAGAQGQWGRRVTAPQPADGKVSVPPGPGCALSVPSGK
jgi:hypothetical protein